MHVTSTEPTPQERRSNRSESEDEDLDRVGVLGRESERSRKLVVEFVNVLVDRSVVQQSVRKVVPRVLENEKECDLWVE